MLAAVCIPLSAQTGFSRRVDRLVAAAPAYGEYHTMKRALFDNFPVSETSIVLIGDSLTDRCEWPDLLGCPDVLNRGISGDRVRWIFDRYVSVAEAHPAKLFFLAGENDLLAGTKPHDVVIMIAELLSRFHEISPGTRIYVESMLPLNFSYPKLAGKDPAINRKIDSCNRWLERWCRKKGYTFINVAPLLKQADGQFAPEYTSDGLHPSVAGYLVWKGQIDKFVRE